MLQFCQKIRLVIRLSTDHRSVYKFQHLVNLLNIRQTAIDHNFKLGVVTF